MGVQEDLSEDLSDTEKVRLQKLFIGAKLPPQTLLRVLVSVIVK